MKDGYRYQDGKVIVSDYSSDKIRTEEKREYQDNIDEILITENIVEYLDDLEDDMMEDVEEIGNKIDVCYLEIIGNVIGMISLFIVLGIFLNLVISNSIISIIISSLLSGGYYGLKKISPILKKLDEYKKDKNGLDLKLKGIEEEIIENEAKLVILEIDDKRDKEEEVKNNNEYKQLDYVDKLQEVEDYLDLWYQAGKNEEEYLEYLDQGILDEELGKIFEQEDRTVLKRVLTNKKNKK